MNPDSIPGNVSHESSYPFPSRATAPSATARPMLRRKPVKALPPGHEAFLKALETSKAEVSLEEAASGDVFTGTIKHSDKFTISLIVPESEAPTGFQTYVFFKSNLAKFWATGVRPATIGE